MTTDALDPYSPLTIHAAAGGHVLVGAGRDGSVSLYTSKPNGRPGTTLLREDEVRSLIRMLERMVNA